MYLQRVSGYLKPEEGGVAHLYPASSWPERNIYLFLKLQADSDIKLNGIVCSFLLYRTIYLKGDINQLNTPFMRTDHKLYEF